MTSAYTFRPVTRADLPMVARWLAEPHVARWWGDPQEQLALIAGDLDEPLMALTIVSFDGEPLGYLQSFGPASFGVLAGQPSGTRGVDQFVGPPAMAGQGHGPRFMAAYCETLFEAGAPRVVTDPDPENPVAIRAYEKAGFRRIGLIETQDGPAVLMAKDRAYGNMTT